MNDRSDQGVSPEGARADREDGFPQRMEALISRVGSVTELAKKSRLSRRVIDNYKAGLADPSRARLIALADAGGVSVEWLVTGKGPMRADEVQAPPPAAAPATVDAELLAQICEQVAEVYRQEGARTFPGPMARLSARMYKDLLEQFTPEERPSGLKGMLLGLRRELRSPPAADGADGKRLA